MFPTVPLNYSRSEGKSSEKNSTLNKSLSFSGNKTISIVAMNSETDSAEKTDKSMQTSFRTKLSEK